MDIASMLEVQVNEVNEPDIKENVTPRATFSRAQSPPLKPYSQEENNYFKMMYGLDISSVRFSRIHCTACDVHIGSAPVQVTNMFEHPKLRTLLCLRCYEFYGDGDFEQGDDQTDMFCRWCANGGNLYCCSFCSNTFCSKCVKRNFDAVIAKKIEDDEKWKCFVCDETDLYAARALCRAIIQHVQTVCRILQNDKAMNPVEVDEKMNLDEARCCIRKRKRKRRKTGSGSEDEDDETYNPLLSEMPLAKRRRTRKSGQYSNIHTNGSANNQSDDEGSLLHGENDLLPSMIPCEQSMTEGETALPFGTPTKVVNPMSTSVITPIVTNNTKTPVSTLNLLKPLKVRRLTPVSPLPQMQPKPILLQKRTPNRPMVSIPQTRTPPQRQIQTPPQRSVQTPPQRSIQTPVQRSAQTPVQRTIQTPQQKKARILLPKPRPTISSTPKIIELDSDSDSEAVQVIQESDKSTCNNIQNKSPAERNEMNKTFEQTILNQKHDVDQELQTLRRKFNIVMSESPNKTQFLSSREATAKMKQFHQVMRKSLYRLAQINDRIMREYQIWYKQSQSKDSASTDVELLSTKDPEVLLDMICTRDSESEDEDDIRIENNILEATNFEANLLNCYNNLTLFRKKQTVDQAVGEGTLKREDKSIQVYDVRTLDYEKSIGYSLLMKAEYDPKTEKEVLKPVEVLNEHFGKFQEQYIYHLQYIEEHGIKTNEDLENLPDPNETSLKDLIEANSPFIAEMLENIPPTVANGSATDSETVTKDTELETEMETELETGQGDSEEETDSAKETELETEREANLDKDNFGEEIHEYSHTDSTAATSKAVEELVKMVTKLSDELKSSNNSPENTALSSVVEAMDVSDEINNKDKANKGDDDKDETVLAVRTLIEEEENSGDNNFNKSQSETGAIEECNFLN